MPIGLMDLANYVPEIIVGLVLAAFAWSFRAWSYTINENSEKILTRLEKLSLEFHNHRIQTENRVTRVETELTGLIRQLDRAISQSKMD